MTKACFNGKVPQKKQLRVFQVIKIMCKKARSIDEMEELIGTSQRTVYRYLAMLEALGIDIYTDSQGRYFLRKCPICGK